MFNKYTSFPYPDTKINSRIFPNKTINIADKKYFGKSWLRKSRGITEIYLEGDNISAGYAHSILVADEIGFFDEVLMHQFDRLIKNPVIKFIVAFVILFKFDSMENYIDSDIKDEIYAFSLGYSKYDKYRLLFPTYPRILYYHAIHDIGQDMMSRYHIGGCTAFASKTISSGIMLGRNFDFEGGNIFDKRKAVIYFKIKNRIPFVSLAWPGMMGVVSGMNKQKIALIINAAGSDDSRRVGIPTSILARNVLEKATTLNKAVEIIKKGKVFVTDIFMLVDGKTGEAAIIEKSPRKTGVIRLASDFIAAANHLVSNKFKNDKENIKRIKYLTTLNRYKRVYELLKEYRGKMDKTNAVKILRDRRLSGGINLALGNRNALNALIASHSVIFLPKINTLYVGKAPHTLGRYVSFNIDKIFSNKKDTPSFIPADNILTSGKYALYLKYKALYSKALMLFENGYYKKALKHAVNALALNAGSPEGLFLIIRIYDKIKNKSKLKTYCSLFLNSYPQYYKNVQKVKNILKKVGSVEQ
jgi:tetratricopeptide (TPR) repeat protein